MNNNLMPKSDTAKYAKVHDGKVILKMHTVPYVYILNNAAKATEIYDRSYVT
jgi:hypothetical protein